MIETCPRYSRNLIREGEVRVKYETKVPSRGCGRKGNSSYSLSVSTHMSSLSYLFVKILVRQ